MNRKLQILFFGYHHNGVEVFHRLRGAGHEIVACHTHSAPAAWIPSVEQACAEAGIPCSNEPAGADAAARHRVSRPDLLVSAGYQRRVTLPFLSLPRLGALNVANGPLPRFRGPTPVTWGLLHDEQNWGVTVHAMTHNYNDGAILHQSHVPIEATDNAYDLLMRCGTAAAEAICATVDSIATGRSVPAVQDIQHASTFMDAIPYGGKIDWKQPAAKIAAFVRALDFSRESAEGKREHLHPPAQAKIGGHSIGMWRVVAGGVASPYPPGTITRCDDQVWVQTGRGHLILEKLVNSAGHDVDAPEFFAAHKIGLGESFDTQHAWRKNSSPPVSHAA